MAMLHPDHVHDRARGPGRRLLLGVALAALAHGGLVLWLTRQGFAPPVLPPDDPAAMRMEVYRPVPPPEPVPAELVKASPVAPERPTVAPRAAQNIADAPQTAPFTPAEPDSAVEGPPRVATTPAAPPIAEKPAAPPAADPVVRAPALLRPPSAADLARFYPDRAQRLGVEGRTEIACTIDASGRAAACRVLGESPADAGFGRAALDLARTFRFSPKTVDGKAVGGGEVRIPLRWTLAE